MSTVFMLVISLIVSKKKKKNGFVGFIGFIRLMGQSKKNEKEYIE